MSTSRTTARIGIYGADESLNRRSRGCCLWPAGYKAAVTAAEAEPVSLRKLAGCTWDELLEEVDGVIFAADANVPAGKQADEERLCEWCRELNVPFLGVDRGLHVLNSTYGGTLYQDLWREAPDALQHQRQPEEGDRHAINVVVGSRLAKIYGEGEIVVNSEHRKGICKLARGFRVSATALDGVIEAIEPEEDGWFCLGVQWNPASVSASGLDIQLFRGLIDACGKRRLAAPAGSELVAA